MISKKEQIAIKKFFGVNFADTITELLKKGGYKNRNNDCYLKYSVLDVLNGRSSKKLEGYIIEIWEQELRKRERERNARLEKSKALI